MTEDFRDIHARSVGTPLALEDYRQRDLLAFFQRNGLRKAAFPTMARDRAHLEPEALLATLHGLEQQGLLQSRQMGRSCGPFRVFGYVLTRAGELQLETLQGRNSQQIELRAMQQLLQQANTAKGPCHPHVAYITPERQAQLVAEHIAHQNLREIGDGKVQITAAGQRMLRTMEAMVFTVTPRRER